MREITCIPTWSFYMLFWATVKISGMEARCMNTTCPETCKCYTMYTHDNASNTDFKIDCSSTNLSTIPTQGEIPTCSKEHLLKNSSVQYSLYLRGNIISSINELRTMDYLRNIRVLDLSENLLSDISGLPLYNMTSLTLLLLHDNLLTFLPVVFEWYVPGRITIFQFSLYNNPWSCDCTHRWMRGWFERNVKLMLQPNLTQCSSPQRLKERPLLTTSASEWNCLASFLPEPFPTYAIVIIILVIIYLLICTIIAMCVTCRNRYKVKAVDISVIYKVN